MLPESSSLREQPVQPLRIAFVDGFRGVAIGLVLLFHAFSRWPGIVPYGRRYAGFPVFAYGWLGVELFFMISGYVILMTLEACDSFKTFLVKRWLRLFPAMLAASALIYGTARFLPKRPLGIPIPADIIPGLLFVEPEWISGLLRIPVRALDGAYWSLFVEVKYYLVFGLLFFLLKKGKAVVALFALFVLAVCARVAVEHGLGGLAMKGIDWTLTELSFQYFGWFAAGSLLYLYRKTGDRRQLLFGAFSTLASILWISQGQSIGVLVAATLVSGFFFVSVLYKGLGQLFENRFLLFLGFISYPLYLIHQNALIGLIARISRHLDFLPPFLLPLGPILLLIMVAYLIAKFFEPNAKRLLVHLFASLKLWLSGGRARAIRRE
jgi:peptidoglycan/LPS O-acetylase OafA/YrhL